jgi:hypothetical protein
MAVTHPWWPLRLPLKLSVSAMLPLLNRFNLETKEVGQRCATGLEAASSRAKEGRVLADRPDDSCTFRTPLF